MKSLIELYPEHQYDDLLLGKSFENDFCLLTTSILASMLADTKLGVVLQDTSSSPSFPQHIESPISNNLAVNLEFVVQPATTHFISTVPILWTKSQAAKSLLEKLHDRRVTADLEEGNDERINESLAPSLLLECVRYELKFSTIGNREAL